MHRGVEDVARTHGVLTFAGSSDEEPERERELADAFGARGVDGLVIVPCSADQGYLQRERRPAPRSCSSTVRRGSSTPTRW